MGRINLAVDDGLGLDLSHEARKQNKSLFAATNEAIELYLKIVRSNHTPESAVKTIHLFEIYNSAYAIPIPEPLLDEVLQLAYGCSKERLLQAWKRQGRVIGELVKGFAPSIEDVKKFTDGLKGLIPPNLLQLALNDQTVEIVMTGTGYSEEASACTSEGIKGFLEAYDFSIDSVEVSRSFVKVRATKKS
ncbi:MAG: hypothetical protein QW767_01930 [Thermoprotei archaeon]